MVTGWPEVRLTPYIGAVVLYVVLHSRDGARFSGGLHCGGGAPLLRRTGRPRPRTVEWQWAQGVPYLGAE